MDTSEEAPGDGPVALVVGLAEIPSLPGAVEYEVDDGEAETSPAPTAAPVLPAPALASAPLKAFSSSSLTPPPLAEHRQASHDSVAGFGEEEDDDGEDQRRKSSEKASGPAVNKRPSLDEVASNPSGSGGNNSEEEEDDESEQSDRWPPRRPIGRFRLRMQFSERFKPSNGVNEMSSTLNPDINADLNQRMVELKAAGLKDMHITWINMKFAMAITTEFHFEIGFPIILLTILDAIYAKRVRWREVDWRFQYKRALQKNYQVAQRIWVEVNMEKAREFRPENTQLRLENMSTSTIKEKLEFLRLVKRWFDVRIHHAPPYDPMERRREAVKQCVAWGHAVDFPQWIKFDKEEPKSRSRDLAKEAYDKMPEFKRLIWFLGSPEHQTM